ncbi:centrosomal protein of 85 kDa-like isoform 2-T2 [Odontesthes bonariensis]|uniref:centrosomal protein of 85 kDa-like isoform X2 n=1 Tax=Odontesthes bonariensis TaxID=219752 RepID=UPI003F584F56
MWRKSDFEDGSESKAGPSGGSPGWVPGHESAWHSSPPGPISSTRDGRRHSTVSDSGDTGIGTYCSDSVEDDSGSSTTPLSFQPLPLHHLSHDDHDTPGVPVMSSSSSSPGNCFRVPASLHSTGRWSRSCHFPMPATSPVGAPNCLDMRDHPPIRRCSSFTKLSSGVDKNPKRTSDGCQYNPDAQGSLDRSLLSAYRKEWLGSNKELYLPLCSSLICNSLLQRSPGASPGYRYNRSTRLTALETELFPSSTHSSPIKHNTLNMNYSATPEAKAAGGGGQAHGRSSSKPADSPLAQKAERCSPIQPAVRTQMWLTEQMEYRPRMEHRKEAGPEGCGVEGLSPRQQEQDLNQILMGASLPANTLMKVKEGLLRQRELEINRQKQQILQLHARIRENELRAQQVLQSQRGLFDDALLLNVEESATRTPCKHTSDKLCSDEELGRKLAMAELEVLHLKKFFNQVTEKYTEDVRKLEEKIKTRDRYISSLKKKCQRESEQSQEKQQRIETLEKYLSDLPTPDEVHVQSKQQEELQQKAMDMEKTVSRLQENLEEGCALIKKKDIMIEMQTKREKELIATVHSLQEKVQQCLDDGVRLPMQDLKRLEVENTKLLQQQDHSSRLFKHQKEEMERLTSQLMVTSTRLQKKKGLCHQQQSLVLPEESLATPSQAFQQQEEGLLVQSSSHVGMSEVDRLLKEMSLCLLDLQGLCSIMAHRAQGKEPNLSLLLSMKSFSVSAEESDSKVAVVEEELSYKLLEVGQLRRDIDELRRSISDRYAQYMGDSCITQ